MIPSEQEGHSVVSDLLCDLRKDSECERLRSSANGHVTGVAHFPVAR